MKVFVGIVISDIKYPQVIQNALFKKNSKKVKGLIAYQNGNEDYFKMKTSEQQQTQKETLFKLKYNLWKW